MSEEIKVGDVVRWQTHPNALALCNCTVLKFGPAADTGEPAAELRLPPVFNKPDGSPTIAAARLVHLTREP